MDKIKKQIFTLVNGELFHVIFVSGMNIRAFDTLYILEEMERKMIKIS